MQNFFSVHLLAALLLFASAAPAQEIIRGADATAGQPPHVLHGWKPPVEDQMLFNYVLIEQAEYGTGRDPDNFSWDAQGWYGGDYNKFWWKAEGSTSLSGPSATEAELQALYSRMIAPFWNAQAGVRYDRAWESGADPGRDPDRWYAVLGLEGLAPYWFELEPSLFISENGDVIAQMIASYDLLFTQKWILQPRLDVNAAFQEVRALGLGTGVNDMQLGLRLRYEVRREFAPYLGVVWWQQFGSTADFTRADGGRTQDLRVVLGFRAWW